MYYGIFHQIKLYCILLFFQITQTYFNVGGKPTAFCVLNWIENDVGDATLCPTDMKKKDPQSENHSAI